MMDEYIQQLVKKSTRVIPQNNDDYFKDGLLYCGKCNTPKQGVFTLNGKEIKPNILCECATRKRDEEERKAKEIKKMDYISFLKRTGIQDKKLLSYSFDTDNMPDSKHSKAFRRYCDKWREMKEKNIGLILMGDCGTGKSFYSGCIANEIISRYMTDVIATSIPRILNQLFSCESKNSYIKKMADVSLLLIDDLGTERQTDYALEQVYTVIDERYKAEKPLIITTNLTYSELKNPTDIRYKRIYDRIIEMCVPFNLMGISHREEKVSKKKQVAKSLLFD